MMSDMRIDTQNEKKLDMNVDNILSFNKSENEKPINSRGTNWEA